MCAERRQPLRVLLTGGIASGKSTVARAFARLGVPVIDADLIARELTEPGQAGMERLVRHLGADVLDAAGQLDRRRLRERLFAEPGLRGEVEALLHPLILAEIERRSAASDAPYVLIEVPLLAETGGRVPGDRVLVVDCPEQEQIARLMERDGETEAGARRALAAQASRQARLALADDVLENPNGARAELADRVARLHERYLRLAAARD